MDSSVNPEGSKKGNLLQLDAHFSRVWISDQRGERFSRNGNSLAEARTAANPHQCTGDGKAASVGQPC